MAWYVYIIHFVAALFAANSIPHFVNGVSGRKFPTPFAKPPGRGKSSAVINVLWAAFNVVVAEVLLRFWPFAVPADALDVIVFFVGFFLAAVMLASAFSRPRM